MLIGISKIDITGPITEWNLLGFAEATQVGKGILNRLFCRVFTFKNELTETPMIIIHTDILSIPLRLRHEVLLRLEKNLNISLDPMKIVIHAQHTHSAPGGYHPSTLYTVASLGYSEKHLAFLSDRIAEAVSLALASDNIFEGKIYKKSIKLEKTGRNRSPEAFLNNPDKEIKEFLNKYGEMKNNIMSILKIIDNLGEVRGILSFFPIHTTSIRSFNGLINSDNKGFASYLIEKQYLNITAAFFQTEAGDVTPMMKNSKENDLFLGEGQNCFESCEIVGIRQAKLVEEYIKLKPKLNELIKGDLKGELMYFNYSKFGCSAEIGISMLAGTEDNRPIRIIKEGWNTTTVKNIPNKVTKLIAPIIFKYFGNKQPKLFDSSFNLTTKKQDNLRKNKQKLKKIKQKNIKQCHYPKVSYITSSESITIIPEVLPLQILQLGNLILPTLPIEVTSMAGYRIKKLIENRINRSEFTYEILSLSNGYASYLTTPEEYDFQHYEGASTMFGRDQLSDTLASLSILLEKILFLDNSSFNSIDIKSEKQLFQTAIEIEIENKPLLENIIETPKHSYFTKFFTPGSIIKDIQQNYNQIISLEFYCLPPKDSQQFIKSFCNVKRKVNNEFITFLTDHDWSVRFIYKDKFLYSTCTCEWFPESTTQVVNIPKGIYRLDYTIAVDNNIISGFSSLFQMNNQLKSLTLTSVYQETFDNYLVGVPIRILLFVSVLCLILVSKLVSFLTHRKTT